MSARVSELVGIKKRESERESKRSWKEKEQGRKEQARGREGERERAQTSEREKEQMFEKEQQTATHCRQLARALTMQYHIGCTLSVLTLLLLLPNQKQSLQHKRYCEDVLFPSLSSLVLLPLSVIVCMRKQKMRESKSEREQASQKVRKRRGVERE